MAALWQLHLLPQDDSLPSAEAALILHRKGFDCGLEAKNLGFNCTTSQGKVGAEAALALAPSRSPWPGACLPWCSAPCGQRWALRALAGSGVGRLWVTCRAAEMALVLRAWDMACEV